MRTVALSGLSSVVFCFVFLSAAWRIVDTRLFHSNRLGRWHRARLGAPCHFSFVTSSDASVITRYQLMPWWLTRSALRSRGFRLECKLFLCVSALQPTVLAMCACIIVGKVMKNLEVVCMPECFVLAWRKLGQHTYVEAYKTKHYCFHTIWTAS